MLTNIQILSSKSCEEIFVNNKDKTKSIYKELAKVYHPDVYKGSDASEVFMKLNAYYNEALDKIDKGIWYEKDVLMMESLAGKKYKLKYLIVHDFELGKCYIGRKHIIYVLPMKNKKYLDNALERLKNIRYADSNMEKEFKRYLPQTVDTFELKTDEICWVIKKEPTDYSLDDFLDYYKRNGKKLDPKHVTWIISRMNNLACFLKYNNLVLNGFSANNCFISPSMHMIMIYGGWWYAVPVGEKMIGTQKNIFNLMPVKEKAEKVSTYVTDMECIRYIGRNINYSEMPQVIKDWLDMASINDAFKEFDKWNNAIYTAYGERKFITLNLTEKDIYNVI